MTRPKVFARRTRSTVKNLTAISRSDVMSCWDSSFLIDYLNGLPEAGAYMEGQPAGSFYTPSLVLFELYDEIGEYTDHNLDEFNGAMDWVTPLPFTAI